MRTVLRWPFLFVFSAFLLVACAQSEATPTVTPTPTPTPFSTPSLTSVLGADTESSVQLISQADCGENQICYSVTVECNGLVWREVQIRVNHLSESKGAVVFARGGYGTDYYGSGSPGQIVERMRGEGYETYDIRWAGEFGWQTDKFGNGFKRVMCAYAALVRWIATNLADNTEVMGATGNSGGSMHIGYGLALYGLEDILDIVVLTGGPPSADAVDMCYRASGDPALMDPTMGWPDNGDYCERGVGPEWTIAALQAESIVSTLPGDLRRLSLSKYQGRICRGRAGCCQHRERAKIS